MFARLRVCAFACLCVHASFVRSCVSPFARLFVYRLRVCAFARLRDCVIACLLAWFACLRVCVLSVRLCLRLRL